MNHEDNCQLCRDGIEAFDFNLWLFGVFDLTTKIYRHVLARNSYEAFKFFGLTQDQCHVNICSAKLVKKLVKQYKSRGKGVTYQMKTKLEEELAKQSFLATLGQAVLDLVKGHGSMPGTTKRRKRRTKAEMEAVKAVAAPKAVAKQKKKAKAQSELPGTEEKAA